MASNVARGARAKARTKAWLEARGYAVGHMEVVHRLMTPRGPAAVKRDQFGADLIALAHGRTEVLFVQVKQGRAAAGGNFPDAVRAFAEYSDYAPRVRRIVIAWPMRARFPRIMEVFRDQSFTFLPTVGIARP